MKVVILAGGLGTRLREETEFKPKPMVEVGGYPILWHIINHFIFFGFNDFIIAAGYKGEVIKKYFELYDNRTNDFIMDLEKKRSKIRSKVGPLQNLKVNVVDTGSETMTGGRLYQLRQTLGSEDFICTYGDSLANVNLKELVNLHRKSGRIATLTAVKPQSRFGIIKIGGSNEVTSFKEKPQMSEWVNGGYFVFKPEVFNYLSKNSILETDSLTKLAEDNQLTAYEHSGFWRPMDTYREFIELNKLWESDDIPWAVY